MRQVIESRTDRESEFAAIKLFASKLGIISPRALHKWVRQAEVDQGTRPGVAGEQLAEFKRLQRKAAELR